MVNTWKHLVLREASLMIAGMTFVEIGAFFEAFWHMPLPACQAVLFKGSSLGLAVQSMAAFGIYAPVWLLGSLVYHQAGALRTMITER